MFKINRAEKDILQAAFPSEVFVRTKKTRERNGGYYYCSERPAIRNALKKIRAGKKIII